MKKTTYLLIISIFLLNSVYLFAKPEKGLPPGLEKKIQRGGTLPPGWQKKIAKGQVLDNDILVHGKIITNRYPVISGTVVYKIENKVVRLVLATKEIIDILK